MSTGYNMTQAGSGGFVPQRTGSSGILNYQGIPFSQGRSKIATIPEFQRNPMLLEKSLLMTIQEGRANLTKYLYEYAEKNGMMTFNDVKYRWRVKVIPHARFYLKPATYSVTNGRSVFELNTFTKPSSVAFSNGNPNVIGDIARIQEGQHILIMCSFTNKERTSTATVHTDPDAGTDYTYNGKPTSKYPVPEIAKIEKVDYATGKITVLRNWAGAQRTAAPATLAESIIVASVNTAPTADYTVKKDDAFFILLPKTMPEDEIDAKIMNYTSTWQENIMKRTVKAWGEGHFQKVINANLGNEQPGAQSKEIAIKTFYDEIGWDAIWGEKAEGFDDDGNWWGHTDGLLSTLDKGHYIGLAPMNHTILRSKPENAYGSFDIPVFNKLLEDKGYYGSDRKVMLCGSRAYSDFSTMINQMTQDIPNIVSDWKVVGKSFTTSNGLTVDFIPTDVFSLNGMQNYMIMFDPSTFKKVGLKGYPTDMYEISNENPLKTNGFIHGVYSFMDTNPDAHWVFVLDDNYMGTSASAPTNVLGKPHSEF